MKKKILNSFQSKSDQNRSENAPSSDEDLLWALQKGENSALETFYQRHSGKVLSYCQKRSLNLEQCEEVLQIVFLQLYRKRELYLKQHAALAWLYVITRSELKDFRKSENRKQHLPLEDIESLSQNTFADPSTLMKAETEDALSALPAESQRVLRMRYLDEMEYQEIAQRLQQSESSLRQIVSRSLRFLKSQRGVK